MAPAYDQPDSPLDAPPRDGAAVHPGRARRARRPGPIRDREHVRGRGPRPPRRARRPSRAAPTCAAGSSSSTRSWRRPPAAHAPAGIEVLCADAGTTASYAGAVPADLVLVCGVFGNITDADMMHTIDDAADAVRAGRDRDLDAPPPPARRDAARTPAVRARTGSTRSRSTRPKARCSASAMHRLTARAAARSDPTACGCSTSSAIDALDDACPQCGFSYDVGRAEITPWLRSDARAFVERLAAFDDAAARTRPEPDVWSPLEYACHVRDMLRVQTERVQLAQREIDPIVRADGPRRARRSRIATTSRIRPWSPRSSSPRPTRSRRLLDGLDDAGWAAHGRLQLSRARAANRRVDRASTRRTSSCTTAATSRRVMIGHLRVAAHGARVHHLAVVVVDVPGRETLQRLLERDAALEPRQRGAETEVDAVAERDVATEIARSTSMRSGSANMRSSRFAAPVSSATFESFGNRPCRASRPAASPTDPGSPTAPPTAGSPRPRSG